MVQFKHCSKKDRYEISIPNPDVKSIVAATIVGHIDAENNMALYRRLKTHTIRDILLHWDEYSHQMERELDEMLTVLSKKENQNK